MATPPSKEILNNARNIEFAKNQRIVNQSMTPSPECTLIALLEWIDKKFTPKDPEKQTELFNGKTS